MLRNVVIEGKYVILEEVAPKHFEYIIKWRNNPENNRYLNQPYELTMELQQQWYEKYLNDYTQGLLIVIDRKNNTPFGTLGWTDYDCKEKVCVSGRSLVGISKYRGSREFLEARLLQSDYLYYKLGIEVMYAHIVDSNFRSIAWDKKWGFKKNMGVIKYPKELVINGMVQSEYVRTREDYWIIRNEFEKELKR